MPMRVLVFIFIYTQNLMGTHLYAQTLKICLDSPVLEADLHKAVDTSSVEVFHKKIYESLIQHNKKVKGYYTLLAKNISFPSSNKILIELKSNIQFHQNKIFKPSRNLNADDVIFSFERQMVKNIKDPLERKLFSNFRARDLDTKFLKISKIDDYKVLIETNKKIHNVYELLSEHFLSIYSKEYYSFLEKKNKLSYFTIKPIGTGPFLYRKKSKENTYKLVVNKKYHGKVPQYEKLNFSIITNNIQRTDLALKGECHITHGPDWSMLKEIEKNTNLRLENYDQNNMLYLSLNLNKKIFKNIEVRKAIAHALDHKKYLQEIFYGHAIQANHILTPNFKEHNKEISPLERDLTIAKKIIGKYFPNEAPTLNLWTITVPRPYIPNGVKMAEMIKQDLEQIGFKVKISKPKFKDFLKKTGNGVHDIAITGFANITDQEEILMSLTCGAIKSGSNRSLWCNKEFDQIIGHYFSTKSSDERKSLLKKATLIFNKEKPRIPIAYMSKKKIISKKILNFNSSRDSSGDYSKIIFIQNLIDSSKKRKAPSY